MAFEHGVDSVGFYNSSSKERGHELPCKVSCTHCGSLIMDEGRKMVLLFPSLLHYKRKEQRKNFDVQ